MSQASAPGTRCGAVGLGRRRRTGAPGRDVGRPGLSRGPRRVRVVAALLAALLSTVALSSGVAWADGADPTLVSTLTGVEPALPPGVLVQVRTSLAPQMVVANPTPVPLTLLDPTGVPFARVSSGGVEGNVDSPFFHVSLNPPDAPPAQLPPGAVQNAPARWAPVSTSPEWGWFDPRLQPDVGSSGGPGGRTPRRTPATRRGGASRCSPAGGSGWPTAPPPSRPSAGSSAGPSSAR